jgi:hypothetical protein
LPRTEGGTPALQLFRPIVAARRECAPTTRLRLSYVPDFVIQFSDLRRGRIYRALNSLGVLGFMAL